MEELLDEYHVVSIHQPQKKCSVCNCWITNTNFKRHLMSKKHSRHVEWNLRLGMTPVEWGKEE